MCKRERRRHAVVLLLWNLNCRRSLLVGVDTRVFLHLQFQPSLCIAMAPSLRAALAAAITVGSSLVQAQDTCPPGFTRYPCNETDAALTVDDADWFSGMASISASLTWESCPSDPAKKLECAILRVPNDYSSPFACLFLIDLPLVRHPSTKSGAKSIIVNYGGPGANGIESFVKGDGARLAK